MASIKVVIRESKLNERGLAPLYLRLTKHRKATFISLGVYVKPNEWNEKECKVRKSHPNSARLNAYIAQKVAEAEDIAVTMETKSKSLHTSSIKEKINGKAPTEFFPYAESYIASFEMADKIATYKRGKSVIKKLREYINDRTLYFDELTVVFLKQYEDYLVSVLKNRTNTVQSNFRFIRTIVNNAIKEDLIAIETSPFLKYRLKSEPSNRAFLTEEELLKMERLNLPADKNINHHRNIYVFAAYAGGLRISDILTLRWKNFDGAKINIQIHKTKKQLSIKLPDKALQIVQYYKNITGLSENENNFIFPLIKISPDEKNKRKIHNSISAATAYTNKELKLIAQVAGIDKKISFHTSRHTWACRALAKGMSMDKISKLMGHSAIRETQVYAKIVNPELDKAMEIFNT